MSRPLSGANTRTFPSLHAGRQRNLFFQYAAGSAVSEFHLPLIRTTDDAVAVAHEVQGVAGQVGHRDAEQLFGFVYVPQPDILLRAGCK